MEYINIGNMVVNNYLLKTDIGYIAIDTGYAGGFDKYCHRLQKHNISLDDIKIIILTHAHDDHVGFLNELITETNAVVIVDKLAPNRLTAGHNQWIGGCSSSLAKLFTRLMGVFGNAEHKFPPVALPADAVIWNRSSQPLRDRGISADIILLQGHTADSIGILTDSGELFCGDAAMNGFPSIRRNIIWIEDLKEYKNSWDIMIKSKAVKIFPAHGRPFPKADLVRFRQHLEDITIRI